MGSGDWMETNPTTASALVELPAARGEAATEWISAGVVSAGEKMKRG